MISHLCKIAELSRSGYHNYLNSSNKRTSKDELESIIDDYMEYYNNYRYQWEFKNLVPIQYRDQLLAV